MKHLEFPRLLYRTGSAWELETGRYDILTVASAEEAEAAAADGWRLDQYAARDAVAEPAKDPAKPADPAKAEPPTRAELEVKAAELGITFHHKTGDKKLAELIAAKG